MTNPDIKAGIEICLSLNLGKNNRVCPIVLIIVLDGLVNRFAFLGGIRKMKH